MKRFLDKNIVLIGIFVVCLFTSGVTFLYNRPVALIELAIFAALAVLCVVSNTISLKRSNALISSVNSAFDLTNAEKLNAFTLPVIVCSGGGKILWYNNLFKARVIGDFRLEGDEIEQFLCGQTVEDIVTHDRLYTDIEASSYSIYPFPLDVRGEQCYALIFSDETQMRRTYYEFQLTRPNAMLICIDNLDEIMQNYSDSDSDAMRSRAEKMIDTWLSEYGCLVRKLGDGRFIVVCEERDLARMIERKFDILDKIRTYEYAGAVVGITLSIGVSNGETLRKCELNARQALDMAIGRGGDQAAVFKNDSYEFFGGMSKGIEKRSKARTRIVASAISKLIENSSTVFIMGHRFSDLDSIGAAVGVQCAAAHAGKAARIVVNRKQSLAGSLIDMVEKERPGIFCEPKEALNELDKNSLLVIVDTHRAEVLESAELYKAAKTVVVIDHHRKNVDFINDTLVFQHDPNASSTCEMVSELLQYMPSKPKITPCDADAMLSGIMLDTRNFALKTGVRTFEAAAFLRSKGANTVEVRRLFMNKMENFKLRNEIIGGAQTYRGCAIAFADIASPDIRTITSQAADELLNIDGIKASFAMFDAKGTINISARSLGDVNVQIIMESLGGGGHFTMAAAQLQDCDRECAKTRLLAAIDEYYAKLN